MSQQWLKRKSSPFLLATGLLVSLTVGAIPHAGQGESYTYAYYADAARTVEVGGMSYGSCGEPFDWGQHARYFTIRKVTCNPQP
ncbi:MAG: hypothetical protein ACREP7_15475 [Lysobacter sp.]